MADIQDQINFGDLADVLGRAAAGRGQGRLSEGELALSSDRNAISRYLAGLTGYKTALEAPGTNAQNSVRGDLLANMQDAGVSGPIVHTRGQIPQITGGLRPSALSANTRALGTDMSRQALLNQMQGPGALKPPTLPAPTPLPQANVLDKILGAGGLASGVLGALGGKNGGSVDLGNLFSKLKNAFGGGGPAFNQGRPSPPQLPYQPLPFEGWGPLPSDPFDWMNNPDTGWNGLPTDPSGGTGIGPGMQDYYNWFNGGGETDPEDWNWEDAGIG